MVANSLLPRHVERPRLPPLPPMTDNAGRKEQTRFPRHGSLRPMHMLFISDLHLTPERPGMIEAFRAFTARQARAADALYILGDLFEYWVGDDGVEELGHAPVLDALQSLSASGTALYIMRGNRDFLLGDAFTDAVGASLLEEPTRIRVGDEDVLLMHGDSLCTDDVDHQAFRSMVNDPAWQRDFLSRPLAERRQIADDARRLSGDAKAAKSMEIMDVNAGTVSRTMREHGVRVLIHGHTHRPAIHTSAAGEPPTLRIVLGDWYEHASVLTVNGSGFRLQPGGWTARLPDC